ncbi:hypothetical protein J2Z69_001309 [Paenibacillus shirakamiensis]|uniref:SsuA/THI5-like domain-containing protein n=1 Tax=Paenibacillus shirakamiensis TaxID=1265935 RepID=A0ABS4JGX0_9BACL|nr:hypothetical protein [Paenibacillus shirakamiensis]MBP2000290.1 hypothetical protein [Paenibacillus shirakamiensis]
MNRLSKVNDDQSKPHNHFFMGIVLIGIVMLMLQACSNQAGSDSGSNNSIVQAAGNTPKVLHYGFIGSNKLNLPGGAEGWGFYKGIMQRELKKHGITEVQLTGFPNGPDQTESLISGRLDVGVWGIPLLSLHMPPGLRLVLSLNLLPIALAI